MFLSSLASSMPIGQSQVVLAVEQLADWLRESVF